VEYVAVIFVLVVVLTSPSSVLLLLVGYYSHFLQERYIFFSRVSREIASAVKL
jgi:hypothetical protein